MKASDEEEAIQTNCQNEKSSWGDELQELRHRLNKLEQENKESRGKEDTTKVVGFLQREDESTDHTDTHGSGNTNTSSSDTIDKGKAFQLSRWSSEANLIDQFELPESTYSLLIASDIISLPFVSALLALGLSLMCLVLTLLNTLENTSPGNPLGVPVGLPAEVRMAQYLGLSIGVLMENEIPTALEIIGKGAAQDMSRAHIPMRRIIFSCFLRLVVGYLFLLCLFFVVVQESMVIDIFFNILGLEFVENIDDCLFALFKRGFFGRRMRHATNSLPSIESSTAKTRSLRHWTKRFIRLLFFVNMCMGVVCLTFLSSNQDEGDYRCTKISVSFGDEIWEEAYISSTQEKKLLIYSHFNGIYIEDGTHDGRPRYVERSKKGGEEYKRVIPAEIVFCSEIGAWVLRHDDIRTSDNADNENPCSWLMKSQATDSFDIIELGKDSDWFVWKGVIESKRQVSIECNQCGDQADCNYNGECVERECVCNDAYFGALCQFTKPCNVIRSAKDNTTVLDVFHPSGEGEIQFVESYGRPIYVAHNMTGKPYSILRLGYPETGEEYFKVEYENSSNIGELPPHKHFRPSFYDDDDFFSENSKNNEFKTLLKNYSFALYYTGMRWYGGLFPADDNTTLFNDVEYHAFWDNAFSGLGEADNSTFLISSPTFGGSPTGVNFYEMRRRNLVYDDDIYEYDYDFFGVLIPLIDYEGAGFFHCNK